MAAPQIPNLLSMRGRGGGRGRGRFTGGRGDGPQTNEDPEVIAANTDQIIQQTDTDANLSRLSAVEAGYLDDPFATELAPKAGGLRRLPIINRGEQRPNAFLHRSRWVDRASRFEVPLMQCPSFYRYLCEDNCY